MSVNCNKIVQLEQSKLEAKAALGATVSTAVHGAMSYCFRAVEAMETAGAVTGAESVYFNAAVAKLDAAAQALRGMRSLLSEGALSPSAAAWLSALDDAHLYEVGLTKSLIVNEPEQWARLIKLMRSGDHLAVTNALIGDVEHLKIEVCSMMDGLCSSNGSPASFEQTSRARALETALLRFSIFAQMVAYLNAIEPMDKTVCR